MEKDKQAHARMKAAGVREARGALKQEPLRFLPVTYRPYLLELARDEHDGYW